jgi:hypothetical protein
MVEQMLTSSNYMYMTFFAKFILLNSIVLGCIAVEFE